MKKVKLSLYIFVHFSRHCNVQALKRCFVSNVKWAVIEKKEPKVGGNVRKAKPNIHAHLPPELLVRIDVPRSVTKSIYLLPSVMHRLESLMLASQLREEIGCCSVDNFSISSTSVWFFSTLFLSFKSFEKLDKSLNLCI